MNTCHYGCGMTDEDPDDLRPYGPDGAMVCYDCAMATPEREAQANEQMFVVIDKALDQALASGEPLVFGGGIPRCDASN